MLRSWIVVATVTLLLGGQSFAQDDREGSESAPAEEAASEEPAAEEESSSQELPPSDMGESEANRQNKIASVVGELGLAIAPLPTVGFAGGYYIMPDLLAEFSLVVGSFEIDKTELSWSYTSLRAKWFLGNSFYLNLGFANRSIDFKSSLTASAAGQTATVAVDASAKSSGIDFAIGNRWQWEYFSVGCDWLGYFQPLSSSGDDNVTAPGVVQKELNDFNDLLEQLGETPHLQLLRFYIGASF